MNRRTLAWSVVGLTILGLALRLLRLAWQPLWWDEGYSVYFATEPLGRMLQLTAQDIHPPLYYALLHGWVALMGRSDPIALRAFSVAWGVTALPLIIWLARVLFPARPRIWLLAGLLLAVSPMHIFYSQEIRMYGMAMTLIVASTALFWRTLQQPSWRRAGLYVIAALAALYTLYYSALALGAHFAWGLWRCRRKRARWLGLLGMGGLIALGYLPWLVYAAPKLAPYVGNKIATDADSPLGLIAYVWRHSQAFFAGHVAPAAEGAAGAALALGSLLGWVGLICIGIGFAMRKRNPSTATAADPFGPQAAATALLTFALLPAGSAFLLNLRLPFFPDGGERLLLMILPYVLLLLAASLDWTWPPPHWGKWGLAALLVAALAGLVTYFTTSRYVARDYRPLIGQIVQQGSPEDTVFAIFPWQVGYWRAYVPAAFRADHGPEAQLAAEGILAWGPELQAALDEALSRGTVWLPEPLSFGSTLPGEIEAYLMPRSANLVNRWYSPTTRLTAWRVPPQAEPAPVEANFGPATLRTAAVTPGQAASANEAVAVTLSWQVDESADPADYYVTLRLFDEDGRQWAARDYAPVGGLALETDGATLVEQAGLTVPAGLPPGRYTLAVGLGEAASQALLRPNTLGDDVEPFQPLAQIEVTQPDGALPIERLPIQFPLAQPVADAGLLLLGHAGATDETPTLAGTELTLRLFFQNKGASPPSRRLFVSLRDDGNRAVAEWEGWPLPDYPTEAWPQGALAQMPVAFFVPATVVSGDYTLIARLVDPAGEQDGPIAELGTVAVRQRVGAFDAPPLQAPLDRPVRFGTHVDLIGYDVTQTNNTLDLRLHWRARQPLLPPHHIFVHLDEAAGLTLAQDDGAPMTADGPAPSGSWLPGEYLTTKHRVELPPSLPEDALLRVGLYNPEGNIRLPASVEGASADDAAELALP